MTEPTTHKCCVHTAHCYAGTLCPECTDAGDVMVPVELVPVVIGVGTECCEHGTDAEYHPDCPARPSLGLSDETGGLSDCNRARGHLYRKQDLTGAHDPENIVVMVRKADLPWFDKVWEGWDSSREREMKRMAKAYDEAVRDVAGVDPKAIHNPYRSEM